MKRFAAALILVLAATTATAAERHSGRVAAIDPAAGTLRMEELVEGVGTEPRAVERTLRLAPGTAIEAVRPPAMREAGQWPDAWEHHPVSAAAVKPGDFVTLTTSGDEIVAMHVIRP